MLACFRPGLRRAALHRAAARQGPRAAPAGRAAAAGRRATSATPRCSRRPAGPAPTVSVPCDDAAGRAAASGGRPRPRRPVPDHLHLRHRGRAEGGPARPALPRRPDAAGRHWLAPGPGELVWCTAAVGLVEVGAQRVHRAVAARRRRAAARRALRPARAARADRPRARRRALHGADRVPRDRQARDDPGPDRPARRRRRRRGAQPRGAARLARGDRPLDPRRLRPDRDRPAHRHAARRSPPSPARWASRCRACGSTSTTASSSLDPQTDPTFFLRYLGEDAGTGRSVAHRRPRHRATTTATCTSRAAPTT